MAGVLPLKKVEEKLANSKLPGLFGGKEYVLTNHRSSPELFTKWFNSAENQLKRNGISGSEYSLWIAANCVESINRKCFRCYYCRLDFSINTDFVPDFEHYLPKIQTPGSVVFACRFCNRLKDDSTPELFLNQLKEPKALKGLQPKNKHFAPLVGLHTESRFVVTFMKKFIQEDFMESITSEREGDIIDQYCRLFRERYVFMLKSNQAQQIDEQIEGKVRELYGVS